MTLLFWSHHRPHSDFLLFPVTYCTCDTIVLVTSIVLVTLLFLFTISNLCLWPYSLRLDFLYHLVYRTTESFPSIPCLIHSKYSSHTRSTRGLLLLIRNCISPCWTYHSETTCDQSFCFVSRLVTFAQVG